MKLRKPKRRLAKNTIIEIVWDDAAAPGDMWGSRRHPVRPIRCVSIGYELERSRRHITINQTISGDGGTGHQFSIPAGMIVSIKRIRR